MCGGTKLSHAIRLESKGLSPRVRGNPPRPPLSVQRTRSIPACAGEPKSTVRPSGCSRVYPRVCGGTRNDAPRRSGARGLSPRVRGNPFCPAHRRLCEGSIPACAGEPRRPDSRSRRAQVYPRVCGGTVDNAVPCHASAGLSPRVRGNHVFVTPVDVPIWSIPACAGEPKCV